MGFLVLLLIGVVFSAFAALVFLILTLLLGAVWDAFDVDGLQDGGYFQFYLQYWIVAAVYTFVTLPLGPGLVPTILGIGAMAFAYEKVFGAGWTQAIVMSIVGGVIAQVLFIVVVGAILQAMGVG